MNVLEQREYLSSFILINNNKYVIVDWHEELIVFYQIGWLMEFHLKLSVSS
jgi:hypothetical protein